MKEPTDMGMNRTGIDTSPKDSERTCEGAAESGVAPGPGRAPAAAVGIEYARAGEPIGSVPPPGTRKGVAKMGKELLTKKPTVFLDKLGERVAFERTGTRLYELLITKLDALGTWDGGPSRERLARFHDDELDHFRLVEDAMRSLGADPTAVTPSADVAGVEAQGVLQVIADPRTTLDQSLHAILVAELADNAAWEMLIDLATATGHDELVQGFRTALDDERVHLAEVRSWLSEHTRAAATRDLEERAA